MQDEKFLQACRSGDIDTVEDMLNTYKYVWIVKNQGLEDAVYYAQVEICRLLLEKGANPDGRTTSYTPPLIYAVRINSMEICQLLLNYGANVLVGSGYKSENQIINRPRTSRYEYGVSRFYSPLMHAITDNRVNICRLLLEKGARLHFVDSTGQTMLEFAAMMGYLEICELLLKHDADANEPLWFAATYGHMDVCRLLLDNGANVNHLHIRDGKTTNALIGAVIGKHKDICRMLLDRGADKSTCRPLNEAIDDSNWNMCRFLIQQGVPVTISSNIWQSVWPSLYSIIESDAPDDIESGAPDDIESDAPDDIYDLILAHGADVNRIWAYTASGVSYTKYTTPLISAINAWDSVYWVRRLLDSGADPNLRIEVPYTTGPKPPLWFARSKDEEIAVALLEEGADMKDSGFARLSDNMVNAIIAGGRMEIDFTGTNFYEMYHRWEPSNWRNIMQHVKHIILPDDLTSGQEDDLARFKVEQILERQGDVRLAFGNLPKEVTTHISHFDTCRLSGPGGEQVMERVRELLDEQKDLQKDRLEIERVRQQQEKQRKQLEEQHQQDLRELRAQQRKRRQQSRENQLRF